MAPGYIHPGNRKKVEAAAQGEIPRSKTTFLSPFDPLVWDRKRALDLFGFDYKIEVYTPAPKRKYGYFTLPILYDNALIGRIDPKAYRKEGIFEVKALHLEPGVVAELKAAFNAACSGDHPCQQRSKSYAVETREVAPDKLIRWSSVPNRLAVRNVHLHRMQVQVSRSPGGKVILLTKVLLKLVGLAAARSTNEAFCNRMTFSFWSTKESTGIVKK